MIRSACLLVLLIGQAASARTVEKEFTYQGRLSVACWPGFDNGHLIIYDTNGRITLRPPNGAPAITVSAGEPVAGVPMSNAAVDTDGSIATTVNRGSVWGIVLFRPDGRQERFIETTPFAPTAIRFGPDHTLWTAVYRPNPTRTPEPDYAIVRNYSRDGRLLNGYLPRNLFDTGAPLTSGNFGMTLLHVAGGRIGILLDPTTHGRKPQWLEMDMAGQVTGRWDLVEYIAFALTPSGSVYGSDGPGTGFAVFDRTTKKWNPVSIPSRGRPVGVEGDQLVFLEPSGLAQWVSVPK